MRAQGHDPQTNQNEHPIEYVKSLPAEAFELGAGAVDCCRLFSMMGVERKWRKERKKGWPVQRGQKNEQTTLS